VALLRISKAAVVVAEIWMAIRLQRRWTMKTTTRTRTRLRRTYREAVFQRLAKRTWFHLYPSDPQHIQEECHD
jgi:hypothetical protein